MAALKKWQRNGLTIEMWETSFRVNNSRVFHLGEHATKDNINHIVDTIYDFTYNDARKQAISDLAEEAADKASKDILKKFEGF